MFGGPWIGPHPVLSFKITTESGEAVIYYEFYWPEYYVIAVTTLLFGIASAIYAVERNFILRLKFGFMMFSIAFVISMFFIYVDVKYFSNRIRKVIKKET